MLKITDPDHYGISYAYYPGTSLLMQVKGNDGVVYAESTDYTASGQPLQIDYGNKTATRFAYQPLSGRLHSIVTADPGNLANTDLQRKVYSYSHAGDIASITDDLRGVTYTYRYDSLHRLLEEESSRGNKTSYTYDALGNILTRTTGTRVFTYAYNDPLHRNALSGITVDGNPYGYSYNAVGDMTNGPDFTDAAVIGTRSITYGADGMPSKIINTRTNRAVEFTYGGSGARAIKRSDSSTTIYARSHYEVTDGVSEKYIFAGGLRIAKIRAGEVHYYHQDHLGSTGVVTDSMGMKVEVMEYMPFGPVREQSGKKTADYLYTGKELDPETGLYNYGARLYDPMVGRFVMADTVVPDAREPQSLNPYSYALNNPLIYNDPTGHYANRVMDRERAKSGIFCGTLVTVGVTLALTGAGPVAFPIALGTGLFSGAIVKGAVAGAPAEQYTKEAVISGGFFLLGGAIGVGVAASARVGILATWAGEYTTGTVLGNIDGVPEDLALAGRSLTAGFITGLYCGAAGQAKNTKDNIAENQNLKAELKAKGEELQSLKRDKSNLLDENLAVRTENNIPINELNARNQSIDRLLERVEKKNDENFRLTEKINTLNADNDKLWKRLNEMPQNK